MDEILLDNFHLEVMKMHESHGADSSIIDPIWFDSQAIYEESDPDDQRWLQGQFVAEMIEKLCVFVAETIGMAPAKNWTLCRWNEFQPRMLLGEILAGSSLIETSGITDLYGQSLVDFIDAWAPNSLDENIIAEFPFGMRLSEGNLSCLFPRTTSDANKLILGIVELLAPGSCGVFVVDTGFSQIINELPRMSAQLLFVVQCNEALHPEKSELPHLIAIKKCHEAEAETQALFLVCGDRPLNFDPVECAAHFIQGDEHSVEHPLALWLEPDRFKNFHAIGAQRELRRFQNLYDGFELVKVVDLIENSEFLKNNEFPPKINLEHIDRDRSIFFTGHKLFAFLLDPPKKISRSFTAVVLSKKVYKEWLYRFLIGTEFGRSLLGSIIDDEGSKIRWESFLDLEIPLPSLSDQRLFVDAKAKLRNVTNSVQELERAMSLDAGSSQKVLQLATQVDISLGEETKRELIYRLIVAGESKTVEFKETFSLNVFTKTKDDALVISALKTIVGFLNSDGGTLLIGVSDHPEVVGLMVEIEMFDRGSPDKFVNRFKDSVKRRIGPQYFPDIDFGLEVFEGQKVLLVVKCGASNTECFLDGKDFYARTNPATEKLEGPELVEYTRKRFPA